MADWINPRYAHVIAALRRAQARGGEPDQRPVRGFLVPGK
jgi:hypothetical protein